MRVRCLLRLFRTTYLYSNKDLSKLDLCQYLPTRYKYWQVIPRRQLSHQQLYLADSIIDMECENASLCRCLDSRRWALALAPLRSNHRSLDFNIVEMKASNFFLKLGVCVFLLYLIAYPCVQCSGEIPFIWFIVISYGLWFFVNKPSADNVN